MTYTVWSDLGARLQTDVYGRYYFTPEKYKAENPLEPLVVLPDIESFFGPRVVNIFIVSKPYGWKRGNDGKWHEDWPPEGLTEAVERHKASYDSFTAYRTYVFMDFNFVKKLKERVPKSKIDEMMTATKGRMQDLVAELTDYGFVMGPDIENQVDVEFFYPYLDPLYLINRS